MPIPDPAIPAPGPLVVFGNHFDVLVQSVRETRLHVARLDREMLRAKEEMKLAESNMNSYVQKAAYG